MNTSKKTIAAGFLVLAGLIAAAYYLFSTRIITTQIDVRSPDQPPEMRDLPFQGNCEAATLRNPLTPLQIYLAGTATREDFDAFRHANKMDLTEHSAPEKVQEDSAISQWPIPPERFAFGASQYWWSYDGTYKGCRLQMKFDPETHRFVARLNWPN